MLFLSFSSFLSPFLPLLNRANALFYQWGLSAGSPLIKPRSLRGFGGKRPTTSATKNKKKEELNPKAEQLSAMQLRHQSPVRNFIRKLKATVTMRQDCSEWEGALAFQNRWGS